MTTITNWITDLVSTVSHLPGQASAEWLVDWTLRTGGLFAAGLAAVFWLRRRASAELRHHILFAVLVAAIALPLVALVEYRVPVSPAPLPLPLGDNVLESLPAHAAEPAVASPEVPQTTVETGPVEEPALEIMDTDVEGTGIRFPSLAQWSPPGWLAIVWAGGVVVLSGYTLLSRLLLIRIKRRATPLTKAAWLEELNTLKTQLGIRREVKLYCFAEEQRIPPLTGGTARPWIGLPARCPEWSEARRREVLTHELAHIRRNDCLTEILCQAACALQWWNPLVWWAVARLRAERENACDDIVLLEGTSGVDYAETILNACREVRRPFLLATAPGMAEGSRLETRLKRILDRTIAREPGLRHRTSAALILLPFIVSLPLAWFGWAAERKPAEPLSPDQAIVTGVVVSETGEPVSGIRIYETGHYHQETVTDKEGNFIFPLPGASTIYKGFIASNDDKSLMSFWLMEDNDPAALTAKAVVRFTLSPSQQVTATVLDLSDQPVVGATVGAISQYKVMDVAETGPEGTAVLHIPAAAKVSHLFAQKAGLGLDYYECYRTKPWKDLTPLPDKVDLRLDGAAVVKLRVLDPNGEPLPGIEIAPWYIQKPGKKYDLNFAMTHPLTGTKRVTDAKGVATFDYLPESVVNGVALTYTGQEYFQPVDARWNPSSSGAILETTLYPQVPLEGVVVRAADGKPAPGILLQIEGRGNTSQYYRGRVRTDAKGRFSAKVYPEQSYLIAVTDPTWAAKSIQGLAVHEGDVVDGLRLEIGPGTLLHGVTRAIDETPLPHHIVTVVEQGAKIDPNKLKQYSDPPEGAHREQLVRWTESDENGRYEIRLGPGEYEIGGSFDERFLPLTVAGEAEIQRDTTFAGEAEPESLPLKFARVEREPSDMTSPMILEDSNGNSLPVNVRNNAILTQRHLSGAELKMNGEQASIVLTLTETGATRLRQATEALQGEPIAIVIDGVLVSAPVVHGTLGSPVSISGNFSREWAERVVSQLNAAARAKEKTAHFEPHPETRTRQMAHGQAEFYIEESPLVGGHMQLAEWGGRTGVGFSISDKPDNLNPYGLWSEYMGTQGDVDFHRVKVTLPETEEKGESFETEIAYRGEDLVIWEGDKYCIGIRPVAVGEKRRQIAGGR